MSGVDPVSPRASRYCTAIQWTGVALLLVWCVACERPAHQSRYRLAAPLDPAERTSVLVLGSDHLRGLEDAFDPSQLAGLLATLELYRPTVIAVEASPPAEIARLTQRAADSEAPQAQILAAFAGEAVRYGRAARAALGRSADQAAGLADSMLVGNQSLPVPERRRLVLHLLAAYDVPSALLQWSYLPLEARGADSLLPVTVAEFLSKRLESPNELVSIGVGLARRLGLQRLASIDDHVDDEVGLATGLNDALGAELETSPVFQELRASAYFADAQRRLLDAAATGDLLPLYRRINSPEFLNEDVAAQWHLFYRTRFESGLDRARVALWEARNLAIAGRVREATARHSGEHILIVIGAAHKPFLDRYLAQMMDVEVTQLAALLDSE